MLLILTPLYEIEKDSCRQYLIVTTKRTEGLLKLVVVIKNNFKGVYLFILIYIMQDKKLNS